MLFCSLSAQLYVASLLNPGLLPRNKPQLFIPATLVQAQQLDSVDGFEGF